MEQGSAHERNGAVSGERRSVAHGRRWNDHILDLPTAGLAAYLADTPDIEDALRYVVAMMSYPSAALGAILLRHGDNGPFEVARFLPQFGAQCAEAAVAETITLLRDAQRADGTARMHCWTINHTHAPLHATAIRLDARPVLADAIVVLSAVPVPNECARQHLLHIADLMYVYLSREPAAHTSPASDRRAPLPATRLSARQHQVLAFMAEGLTLRQVAARLGYSESTIRMESLNIYRALGVHERDDAIAAARRHGLISEPEPALV